MEQATFDKAKQLNDRITELTYAVSDIDQIIKSVPYKLILVGAFDDRQVLINLKNQDNQLADDMKDYIVRRLEKERDNLFVEFKKL
jgi:hypothetical protein